MCVTGSNMNAKGQQIRPCWYRRLPLCRPPRLSLYLLKLCYFIPSIKAIRQLRPFVWVKREALKEGLYCIRNAYLHIGHHSLNISCGLSISRGGAFDFATSVFFGHLLNFFQNTLLKCFSVCIRFSGSVGKAQSY